MEIKEIILKYKDQEIIQIKTRKKKKMMMMMIKKKKKKNLVFQEVKVFLEK